jgi:hypothetical protein
MSDQPTRELTMKAILTKETAKGTLTILKHSYTLKAGAMVECRLNGEYVTTGSPVAAKVKGRPDLTHVIGGKVALTRAEVDIIEAAFDEESRNEDECLKARYAHKDAQRRIANDGFDRAE